MCHFQTNIGARCDDGLSQGTAGRASCGGVHAPRNSRISSKNAARQVRLPTGHDSCPPKRRIRAPRIPAAIRRPSSIGFLRSPRRCMTNVGTAIFGSSSITSTSATVSRYRAAHSPDVMSCWCSLRELASSFEQSGKNCVVNSWRIAGLSAPHSRRIRVAIAFCFSRASGERLPPPSANPPYRTRWETRSGCRSA